MSDITFTITGQQVSSVHNAMCYLHRVERLVSENFKDNSEISRYVSETVKYLKPVRDELVKLKDEHVDDIREQASRFKKQWNFKHTEWSIYDISSLISTSNVPVGAKIVADWNSKQSIVVEGFKDRVTWLDLWNSVEKLAQATDPVHGFGDHVFIERFVPVEGEENTFEVWLGS